MYPKLISILSTLCLIFLTAPAYSHVNSSSTPHFHGVIELVFIIAIALILYRIIRR